MVARERLIFAICLVAQALPYFLTRYTDYTFTRFYYPMYSDNLTFYLLTIPLLTYLEISAVLFLLESCKHYLSIRSQGKFIFSASNGFLVFAAIFVTTYFTVINFSWFYYSQTGYFLRPEMLRLFPLLFDFRFVVGTFGTKNLLELLLIFIVSGALGFWIAIYAPKRSCLSFLDHYGRRLLLSALMACALAILPVRYLPASVSGVYRANSFFVLSPQWAIIWAFVRYGRLEPNLPSVSMNLIEQRKIDFAPKGIVSKRNVFLFVIEGLRADAVHQEWAPTLYRLAREGISFDNSYSQSTETSESMLSIITGRYPLKSPLRNRGALDRTMYRVYDGLARVGFVTSYIGEEWSQDSLLTNSPDLRYRFNPLTADFSRVDPADNPFLYRSRGLGDYSLAVADRLKIKKLEHLVRRTFTDKKNIFSILYFISSHFPYDQTDGIPQLRQPNKLDTDYNFLWYPKEIAPIMRNRYLNTIRYIDSLLDSFMVFLKNQNELANSIIIVTGDHGESFWEHNRVGHSRHLDQEAIRVPLIIWGTTGYKKRWNEMTPVSHVDIAPTIYDLVGLPSQLSFQGESVLTYAGVQAAYSEEASERPVFVSTQALMHEDAIIIWPWKFVRNLWGESSRMYRLDNDPQETRNLNGSADAAPLCSCLVGFRASQFEYYNAFTNLETRFYPPKYRSCSKVSFNSLELVKYCEINK
jgi:hypothetical protein